MTVVHFPNRKSIEAQQEEAFEAYRSAAAKAHVTLLLADGIAAGKAWGRFVNLFVKQGPGSAA